MEVRSIMPRSYCRGVVLAIRKALEVKAENPDRPVWVLGQLVHNRQVVQALEQKGIRTIEADHTDRLRLLDEVPEGVVIFTAHGVSDRVRERAAELGLETVDATCPEVRYTQDLVRQQLAEGRTVFYVGKAGHPEAVAVTEGLANIHLITSPEDIPEPERIPSDATLFVTNQTTLSVSDLDLIFGRIRTLYPDALFADEICSATRLRQEAVRKAEDLDILLVVGDPLSNNTAMLARIGEEAGIPEVYRIETVRDLDLSRFKEDSRVGVTAGASTPPYLIRQVEAYLNTVDLTDPAPFPEVDPARILD